MANPPGLQLQLIPNNGNNASINVGDYTFTISKPNGAHWKDITSGKNWEELKATVLALFSEAVEKKTLQSGRMYVDGDFSDIETPTLRERNLTFVSAEVKYLDGAETKSKTLNSLEEVPEAAKQTVREKFTQLGKDFAKIRPLSSPQNNDEYEVVDPRMEICKNRAKHIVRHTTSEKPQLNWALADHLSHMGGFDMGAPSVSDIPHDIANYLKQNKQAVFAELRDHLLKAQEQTAFTKAIQTDPTKFDKFRNLSSVRSQVITDNANDLIEFYVQYIQNGGTLGNEIYLQTFTNLFGKGIVLIEEDGTNKTAKSSFPFNKTTIATKECVFLHLDKRTGKYSTYERTNPTDLDTANLTVQSATIRRKKVVAGAPAAFPANHFVDLGNNGQCLDKSIAYQILKRKNIDPTTNVAALNTTAKSLRTEAARILRDDFSLNNDEAFLRELAKSIDHIPTLDATNPIKQIVTQRTFEGSTADANAKKSQLREFYATYITQEHGTEMNYLDSAFLYVLPKIPAATLGLPYKLTCAVVQGTDVFMKFPPQEELTPQCIFVYYNGSNHYVSFNINIEVTQKINEMIAREHERILLSFAEQIGSAAPIQARLLELKTQYPKAFNAICGLVYEHDHIVWEASDKHLPEPKDAGLPNNRENHPYGEWRVRNATESELKVTLRTLTVRQIKDKINSII